MSAASVSLGEFHSAAATDTGLLRDNNEDRYFIDAGRGVFLVVDGVGGHAAGELAAQTAVETIRKFLTDPDCACDGSGSAAESSPSLPEQRVRNAIAAANNRIFEIAAHNAAHKGMACVLTLAIVADGQITIGHVGDSRLYLIWNGAIRKLTSDHSPVGQDEDAGELTEHEAMRHPRRNEVFRDVGTALRAAGDEGFIEVRSSRFHRDAAILLCSDGLTDHLSAARVREVVERYDGDPAQVANELVEAANLAGGRDNITAVFVAGPEFRGRSGVTRPRTGTTRIRVPRGAFTGRAAFLMYGLLIGMLIWLAMRVLG
jgi:serine/threonine protein phosphatase PrpC